MLRKMMFLAGAGVGYVLGSRACREQYEKIEEVATKTPERPKAREAVDQAAPLAEVARTAPLAEIDKAAPLADKVPMRGTSGVGGDKLDRTPSTTSTTPAHPGGPSAGSSGGDSSLPPRGTFDPVRGIF